MVIGARKIKKGRIKEWVVVFKYSDQGGPHRQGDICIEM